MPGLATWHPAPVGDVRGRGLRAHDRVGVAGFHLGDRPGLEGGSPGFGPVGVGHDVQQLVGAERAQVAPQGRVEAVVDDLER